jgi:SAM-dependent methyltransferase
MTFEQFAEMAFRSDGTSFPAMIGEDVQRRYTGQAGDKLLENTVHYVNLFQATLARSGRTLKDANVMDFGCGFGRFLRMMYYYTDPSKIWAVDSDPETIKMCRGVGLEANFVNSPASPNGRLSHDDWLCNVGFSVSIFTHLAKPAAEACLDAIRHHIKPGGIFMLTIRPPEFWPFYDKNHGQSVAPKMMTDHADGYAYVPLPGPIGKTYGHSSMPVEFFNRPGWRVLESSPGSLHQTLVTLMAV